MINKTSFIIEFDEVSKTQEEKLTEFMEKTGIKFQVLESDNDLKKYKKYKEVFEKVREYIEELNKIIPRFWFTKILELLKEVE